MFEVVILADAWPVKVYSFFFDLNESILELLYIVSHLFWQIDTIHNFLPGIVLIKEVNALCIEGLAFRIP